MAASSATVNSAMLAVGVALLTLIALVATLSAGFYYDIDFSKAPIQLFTALFIMAGAIWICLPWLIPRSQPSGYLTGVFLLLGLAMRLVLFDSYPILEIDFYRYLWDGAVLAHGFNPYALPPTQVADSELSTLALQSGTVFERINYRELSTIYPPVAQLLFTVAYWIDPWQADGLRYVYLVADGITLLLLLKLLRQFGCSPCWSLVYWWSPLLVILTYNGLHMDILLLPLLLFSLYLATERRPLGAGLALVMGAGIKLWPLLLLPFVLRPLLAHPRRLAFATVVITLATCVTLLPMLVFSSAAHSGLAAFSQHWQRNSGLFPWLVQLLSLVSDNPQLIARLTVVATVAGLLAFLLRREPGDSPQLIRQVTVVIAVLFLLNPVQLPWYSLWFLPLLCFYRQPVLLLLVALMPIYFLRFHFTMRGQVLLFDQVIVWLQYLPPLLLLCWLVYHQRSAFGRRHV